MPEPLTSQQKLAGFVKETMQDQVADLGTKIGDVQAALDARKEAEEKWQKDVGDKMDIILASPAGKTALKVPGKDKEIDIVYGHKLQFQGLGLKDAIGDCYKNARPMLKRTIRYADDYRTEECAKFFLTCLAAADGNGESVNSLKDHYGCNAHKGSITKATTLTGGTDATAGYLIPDEWADGILAFAAAESFALQYCDIKPMKGDLQKVNARNAAVSVAWTAEASAATQTNPTYAQRELSASRMDGWIKIMNNLMEDEDYDLLGDITEQFGEAAGQELDNQVLNGSGDPTSGVLSLTNVNSVEMPSGSTAFSNLRYEDLVSVVTKTVPRKKKGAIWTMHTDIVGYIMSMREDGATGAPLWSTMANGQVPKILNYPFFESEKAPASGDTAANTGFLTFCNWVNYIIGRRKDDWTLMVDPYTLMTYYQTRLGFFQRWAFSVGLPDGITRLETAAS